MLGFEGNATKLFKEDDLDKNILDKLSQCAAPKIRDSQMCWCHIIAYQARYRKSQRKDKNCWGNKINPIIKSRSSIKVIVYSYIIDKY